VAFLSASKDFERIVDLATNSSRRHNLHGRGRSGPAPGGRTAHPLAARPRGP
jgi:hypothetical protein